MTVTAPPRRPEIEQDRDLEQRVADLEALIEEARRRARRRRQRNGAAALLVAAAGAAAFIGFGGHGGGGAGTAALAHAPGSQAPAANADSPPLGALPPDAGSAKSFAFDPRNPEIVYVLTVGYSTAPARSHVFKTTDGGAHWQATAARGRDWVGGNEALTADPRHPGTLYAGTELAVYKTVDGGTELAALEARAVNASSPRISIQPRQGMGARARGRPRQHEHRLCRLRPRQQEHRRRPQLEGRVPAAPHALSSENVSALAIAPTRPEAIYAITGEFANPSATPVNRTLLDLQVDRRRHDLAGNNESFAAVSRHRTRRRSATSDHRLRGRRCQRPENDQRRRDVAADRTRPPDRETPAEVVTAFLQGASGRWRSTHAGPAPSTRP